MNYTEFLTSLGFIEVDECRDGITFTAWDGTGYWILQDDICDTDTLRDILRKSQQLSACCGALVDEDYMMCPDCGEHC